MLITLTSGCDCASEHKNSDNSAKADAPAANPSMPSIKLNALVSPTIHSIVSGKLSQTDGSPHRPNGTASVPMRKPPKYRPAASVNCTASCNLAFAPRKSSYTPSAKISVAPANTQAIVRQLCDRFWLTNVPNRGASS